MITLNLNLATGIATISGASKIKAGATVPITIILSADPGGDVELEVSLATDAAPPALLAYLGEFDKENATTYKGKLDANDARLLAAMVGKSTLEVDVELAWTQDDELQIAPNMALTVEPRAFTGEPATEGGPEYIKVGDQIDGANIVYTSPGGHHFRISFLDDGTIQPLQID